VKFAAKFLDGIFVPVQRFPILGFIFCSKLTPWHMPWYGFLFPCIIKGFSHTIMQMQRQFTNSRDDPEYTSVISGATKKRMDNESRSVWCQEAGLKYGSGVRKCVTPANQATPPLTPMYSRSVRAFGGKSKPYEIKFIMIGKSLINVHETSRNVLFCCYATSELLYSRLLLEPL
jgi:hypothetical protein